MDPLEPLLEDADERDRPRPSTREVLGLLGPHYARYRAQLALAALLLVCTIGLGLLAPLLLGQLVDLATQAGEVPADRPLRLLPVSHDRGGLLGLAAAFVLTVGLGFLLEAWLGVLMARVGISMVIGLKEELFRKVLTLDPDFFRDYPPGRLIARVESDTEALKELFSSTALQLLRATLTFAGILVCMAAFDPETTLVVLPVLLLVGASTAAFVTVVRPLFVLSRRYLAAITAHITEYVQGIEVVQHYDYGPRAEESLGRLQRGRYRADVKADFFNYGFWGLFALGEVVAVVLVLWVGAGKVAAGTMTIGTLVVFVEYLRQVFTPIQLLTEFVAQVQRGFVSAGRIFGILSTQPRVHLDPGARADVALERAVRFEDVRFSYDGQREALRGVSFEVRRGERVALVGASGGGKSTIVSLLLRYHDPTAGRITVDGVDLRELSRPAWRRRLGLVPQEVFLFPGSLRDNLTVFDRARAEADVLAACRLAGAERVVSRSPNGLQAPLAERGANLSHGERQLVSMARALVHEPDLLVLDEATSSVDPATEARIQASLEQVLAGRTALIVAHRLSTVRGCDQILVVQQGQIVERGSHDELWALGGVYRDLAGRQLLAASPTAVEQAT